jgi:hypothetical protein
MVALSTRSCWMIWAMWILVLHCIVSSETQFETWWWPSARVETCCLSNKYSTTLLLVVVFWLYYLHHLIISCQRIIFCNVRPTELGQIMPGKAKQVWIDFPTGNRDSLATVRGTNKNTDFETETHQPWGTGLLQNQSVCQYSWLDQNWLIINLKDGFCEHFDSVKVKNRFFGQVYK